MVGQSNTRGRTIHLEWSLSPPFFITACPLSARLPTCLPASSVRLLSVRLSLLLPPRPPVPSACRPSICPLSVRLSLLPACLFCLPPFSLNVPPACLPLQSACPFYLPPFRLPVSFVGLLFVLPFPLSVSSVGLSPLFISLSACLFLFISS